MKSLSIIIPVIVGLCSILLLRDRVDDIAASFKSYCNHSLELLLAAKQQHSRAGGSGNLVTVTTTNKDPTVQQQTDPQSEHLYATEMSIPRAIRKVFLAVEQAEGAGARVRRSVGTPALRNFSPFLMLDHFSIKPGAGFPDQYVSFSLRVAIEPVCSVSFGVATN